MSRRNFSAGHSTLGTILLSPSAAGSKARLATQRTCLRFPRRLPNRSNISQLRAVNTLLPPRRKEPSEDMRLARRAYLDKIRVELGHLLTGSHCSTIVNWSGGRMPELCWKVWALPFHLAQTQLSCRTAAH